MSIESRIDGIEAMIRGENGSRPAGTVPNISRPTLGPINRKFWLPELFYSFCRFECSSASSDYPDGFFVPHILCNQRHRLQPNAKCAFPEHLNLGFWPNPVLMLFIIFLQDPQASPYHFHDRTPCLRTNLAK